MGGLTAGSARRQAGNPDDFLRTPEKFTGNKIIKCAGLVVMRDSPGKNIALGQQVGRSTPVKHYI